MAKRNSLTAERLRALLHYAPDTGLFIWIANRMHPKLVGTVAGCTHPLNPYVVIYCDGNPYRAHRLAWLYMTGVWPVGDIDHRNHITDDNSWANLRITTRSGNQWNKLRTRHNTSGFKGVDYVKLESKWRARIAVHGKSFCLGYFHSSEAAARAYDARAIILHGAFCCLNFPESQPIIATLPAN